MRTAVRAARYIRQRRPHETRRIWDNRVGTEGRNQDVLRPLWDNHHDDSVPRNEELLLGLGMWILRCIIALAFCGSKPPRVAIVEDPSRITADDPVFQVFLFCSSISITAWLMAGLLQMTCWIAAIKVSSLSSSARNSRQVAIDGSDAVRA